MPTLSGLGEFVKAVLEHWVAWGTGSTLTLVLWVLDSIKKLEIPKPVLIGFLVLGFLFSCFQAWQDQYAENETSRSVGSLYMETLDIQLFKEKPNRTDGQIQVGIKLVSNQPRLIEFHVQKYDLTVEGQSPDPKAFTNKGGYIYPLKPTIFYSPRMALPDLTKSPITGELDFVVSYCVAGSKVVHHTSKLVKFDVFSGGHIQFINANEHED